MSATVISGVVAITAALMGLGVWSLVVQALTLSSTRAVLLWIASDWRPRWILDRRAIRDLWGFSSNLAGFNALNYWVRNADNFLVGKFVGPAGLGIYGRAYNLMLMPLAQISWVLSRVMFPVLSRMQSDTARVKQGYLRAIGVIGLVTFPIVTGLFAVAEPFVLTVFGPRWESMVPIVQILCLAGLSQSVGTTTGWIYQSQGRTDWMFRWGLASSAVTLVAFGIGILWGVTGVATAYAVRTRAADLLQLLDSGKAHRHGLPRGRFRNSRRAGRRARHVRRRPPPRPRSARGLARPGSARRRGRLRCGPLRRARHRIPRPALP